MQGICTYSSVPLRTEPSSKSEMVSQLLFGETYRVIGHEKNWMQVVCDFDDYQGWLHENQFVEAKPSEGQKVLLNSAFGELVHSNENIRLSMGSVIQLNDAGQALHNGKLWEVRGEVRSAVTTPNRDVMTGDALQFVNTPYLWGGRAIWGIDCSGFTQVIYKLNGLSLMRDAYQQASQGQTLSFLDETEPGDLAFFDNEDGKIVHVGILLDSRRIIHAGGCVRIDKIDQEGIFNVDTGRYTHKLRLIKKIV